MANRIPQKIKRLELLRDNLQLETSRIIKKYNKEVVRLNYNQMIDDYGSDGKDLFNANRNFSGLYRKGYRKTGRYDFFETGAFKRGLFANVTKNSIEVDSKGKGSGEKSLFFAGYTNLFGLNDDSMKKLRDLIMPELKKYLKSKL